MVVQRHETNAEPTAVYCVTSKNNVEGSVGVAGGEQQVEGNVYYYLYVGTRAGEHNRGKIDYAWQRSTSKLTAGKGRIRQRSKCEQDHQQSQPPAASVQVKDDEEKGEIRRLVAIVITAIAGAAVTGKAAGVAVTGKAAAAAVALAEASAGVGVVAEQGVQISLSVINTTINQTLLNDCH